MHLNPCTHRQAPGEAAYGPLQEASQGGLKNHTYTVRHKLKNCGMMRSFMTSWSLNLGAEFNEGSDRSNTTRVYHDGLRGMPLIGEVPCVYPKPQGPNSLWLGTLGLRSVTAKVFHYPNKYLYIY
jgi:hypothetical protein